MRLFAFLIVFSAFIFAFASCDENDPVEIPPLEKFPSLNVKNEVEDLLPFNIYAVDLVGYEFDALMIPSEDSQTFILDKGMPEGYEDINVEIHFGTIGVDRSLIKRVDFENGRTTNITLNGCEMAQGCDGFYLE